MCEAWNGKQGGIIEILDEDFMVDSCRHEDNLQFGVNFQEFAKLKEQDVAIYGAFVNLRQILVSRASPDILKPEGTYLVNNDMSNALQSIT